MAAISEKPNKAVLFRKTKENFYVLFTKEGFLKKWFLLIAATIVLLPLILNSCSAGYSTDLSGENVKTSLIIYSPAEEKYLTHVLVDNIGEYKYEAVNAAKEDAVGTTNGETLLVLDSSGKGAIGDIEPGLWTFTVKAYNTRGTLLYTGSTTANVSGSNNTVGVALALRKEGNGSVRFKITSRCTGDGTSLVVYYNSYDSRDGGFSENFACACDGLTDTWTGTISIPENRYSLTVRLSTGNAYIASDITDLLVLNGETVDITGVLDGQENQSVTIVPLEPDTPDGYIALDGHAMAGNKVTVSWVGSEEEGKEPDGVIWYMDGVQIGTGTELKITLPGPGMHNLSATAIKGEEYASESYKLNLCSLPLSILNGIVITDYGYANGTYWVDEYGSYYRKESGDPESPRYLVINLFEEHAEDTYTYEEALAIEKNLESLGYGAFRLPTKEDAHNIIAAIEAEKIILSEDFWTSESYDTSYAYMRRENGVSAVSKTQKARVVLVREI